MAAAAGPGRGAQSKDTSANSSTPSSKTTFKKVTGLIDQFDAANMSTKTSNNSSSPVEETDAAKMSSDSVKTSTTPTTVETITPASGESGTATMSSDGNIMTSNITTTPGMETSPVATTDAGAAAGAGNTTPESSTWAARLDRTNLEQDYKLVVWFRKNNAVPNTVLSDRQKGRLVFKMIGVPRGKCVMCDTSKRDRITLTISGSVPGNTLNLTQSFNPKPNLWTKPIAPIVKEKSIFIHWTSEETSNNSLISMLMQFGIVTSRVEYQIYRAKPGADEEEKLMDGVRSADRMVKMKVRKNIPSIVLVDGKKVNIRYEGQAKSCSRCLNRLHICPARGDARQCQALWDDRNNPDDGPHKRAKERGDLNVMMAEAMRGTSSWNTSNENEEEDMTNYYADYVEMVNLAEELTKVQVHEFLKKKDINITIGQLMRDQENKSKWRITELLPQEVACVMMLVNGSKIGSDGRKIECYPAMTSTPPPNRRQPWFAPSRDTSAADPPARRDLTDDLKDLEEGEEVSPDTNVHGVFDAKANNLNDVGANVGSQGKGSPEEVVVSDSDTSEEEDDDEVKEVDADDKTIPKPGGQAPIKLNLTKTGGSDYQVQPITPTGTTRKTTANTTLGVKKDTPKTDKGRTTLKNLMEEAMVEADRAQKEAEEKAAKANQSKEEADLKLAEKAEKAAASARRKSIGLQRKWEDALKLMEDQKRLYEKRSADDQSPGKEEDDDDWSKAPAGRGKGRHSKKKDKKEKTQEEKEIEKYLFNEQ